MARVAPSERFRSELDEALAGVGQAQDPVEAIGRLGAADPAAGARGRDDRVPRPGPLRARRGDGVAPQRLQAAQGAHDERDGRAGAPAGARRGQVGLRVAAARQARDQDLGARVVGDRLVPARALDRGYRGGAGGDLRPTSESRSTVSRILEDTRERYRRWCARRLEQHDVVYCFLDALYLKLHPDDAPAEGVLVAWGVTLEGRKACSACNSGRGSATSRGSRSAAISSPAGLRSPALIVADGAPQPLEGGQGAVARRRLPALHRPRPPQRDGQAARAPPPGGQGALVAGLRRGRLARRGQGGAADDRLRLPSELSVGNGRDRARPRCLGRALALSVRAPQADPLDG